MMGPSGWMEVKALRTHRTSDFTLPPPHHIKQHKSGNQHFLTGSCMARSLWISILRGQMFPTCRILLMEGSGFQPSGRDPPTGLKVRLKGHEAMSDKRERKKNSLILRHKITFLVHYKIQTRRSSHNSPAFVLKPPSAQKRVQLTVAALVSPSLCRITRAEFDIKGVFTLVWWRWNASPL